MAIHSYSLLAYYNDFNRSGNKTVLDATFDSNRSWNKRDCSSWQFRPNWTPHCPRWLHGYSRNFKMHPRSFHPLWPCLSCRRLKPLRHSRGKQSGHKSEHKSSSQRCFWSSLGSDSNQFLLRMYFLCRQQQPPCGETATPSRTQSTLLITYLVRFKLKLWFLTFNSKEIAFFQKIALKLMHASHVVNPDMSRKDIEVPV